MKEFGPDSTYLGKASAHIVGAKLLIDHLLGVPEPNFQVKASEIDIVPPGLEIQWLDWDRITLDR
jgi:hypothetical protein